MENDKVRGLSIPRTRLARNQRLRNDQLTELVCEVISLCHESGARSNAKNLWRGFAGIRCCSNVASADSWLSQIEIYFYREERELWIKFKLTPTSRSLSHGMLSFFAILVPIVVLVAVMAIGRGFAFCGILKASS